MSDKVTEDYAPQEALQEKASLETQRVDPVQVQSSNLEGDAGHIHQGDESDYEHEPQLRDLPFTVWNIPRFLLLGLVRLYQMTLSRTLPQNTCRFYPSCSHYGYQAIYRYGVVIGGLMAIWRVLRCNPFNKGGFDPVP
ncbi:MAG: membrane protein insertion efficiency factor YidD [Chloroflexota bacterium]|nr:membrane protein insertion efficiency factor YidD [Chloroflexota bacterium]